MRTWDRQLLVTLTLYRDCGPTNTTAWASEASEVGDRCFDDQGAHLFPGVLSFTTSGHGPGAAEQSVSEAVTLTIVMEQGPVIRLPGPGILAGPINGVAEDTPATVNIQAPNTQGLTCSILVPPASLGPNDSPVFNNYPAHRDVRGRAVRVRSFRR